MSAKDSVRTPKHITAPLLREFRVKKFYDPVPYNPKFRKGGPYKDALTTEWGRVSFVNPPYSNVKPFFAKAHEQWRQGKTIIMFCKLTNIGSKYAKTYMKGAELRVLSEKVSFPGYGGKLPLFHNVLVIWRANKRSSKYTII
jgi:hypothetical protein